MEKARKKYRHVFQDMSIRKKIFFGYLAIIGIVLLCVIALFAVLWEKLNKDSISKSIYSSNYQIVKSIDNYFDSVIKLSEFPYLDSEIMSLRKTGMCLQSLIVLEQKAFTQNWIYDA